MKNEWLCLEPIKPFWARLLASFPGRGRPSQRYLIHVTLHLFFGAPQLPEAVLDCFDARRGLCILKCVMIVLFHSGLSFTKPPVNRLDRKPNIELTGELQEEMRVNEVLQERVKILLTELGADLPKTVAGFF